MISLNYRDPRPIYEQLEEKLRRLILSGAIPEGERLPSVRELAGQLAINPNTIQRAYRELEQAGFIYSVPGKGSFAGKLSGVDEGRRKELREKLVAVYTELLQLGEDPEELRTMLSVGADAHIGPANRVLPGNEGGCGHPPLQGEVPELRQTLPKEEKNHD